MSRLPDISGLTNEERHGLYLSLFVPCVQVTSPRVWNPGQKDVRILADATRTLSHFALTGTGTNVLFSLTWGTDSTRTINNLIPPFAAALPGTIQFKARPADTSLPAQADATATRTWGHCCRPIVRGLASTTETIIAPAYQLTALSPATVSPPNLPNVVLAAGDVFPVVAPVTVVAGTVVVDYSI